MPPPASSATRYVDAMTEAPKYRQIADQLRRGILDGTYAPGAPLPSEESLARQFGVTRPTVRQGIAQLTAAGLVEVMMGRGAFVRRPEDAPLTPAYAATVAALVDELRQLRARFDVLEEEVRELRGRA